MESLPPDKILKMVCLIATENGKLLLVREQGMKHWILPGGKILPGETEGQCLRRQLAESLPQLTLSRRKSFYCYCLGKIPEGPIVEEIYYYKGRVKGCAVPAGFLAEAAWLDGGQMEDRKLSTMTLEIVGMLKEEGII